MPSKPKSFHFTSRSIRSNYYLRSTILKLFGFCVSTCTQTFTNIERSTAHWLVRSLVLVIDLNSNLHRRTELVVNGKDGDPVGVKIVFDAAKSKKKKGM